MSFISTPQRLAAACLLVSCIAGLSACQSSSVTGSRSTATGSEPSSSAAPSRPVPAVSAVPVFDLGLTVDQAYAAIPHRRTQADLATSSIPATEKAYLDVAFHVVDQAILLRVTAFRQFAAGNTSDGSLLAKMDRLKKFLDEIDPPANLRGYHEHLLKALADQRGFFEDWQMQGSQFSFGAPGSLASHPRVQSASGALRAAYSILMQTYPDEAALNKEAFFDYHCALDFL
jgi:hypothetical protein